MFEIKFNTEFHRWEVYRENGVIGNGEVQPVFVGSFDACETFIRRADA